MSYLFYVDEKNKLICRPECYKLSPELGILKEDELLFVALAFDYHSLYHQFPEHERIKKAMFYAFDAYTPDILDKPSMKLAINAYKSLQYDPKIELAQRYQKKIDRLLQILDEDDTPTGIKKNTDAINALRKNIIDLENEVGQSVVNEGQIKGNQEMSWLEKLQQNQKYYRSLTEIKEK